ncbi:MAG: biopolymer transporter ExbD [Planctomycetes bacterium]|jgi:biopolymer transport protein ExbD|nr:biopolymer transporter ExbD [Planctomycetota bacterium]
MRHDDGDDDGDQDGGLNLTPMIDVVFLLLIFFLAATTFARQEVELDLRLPSAKSGTQGKGEEQLIINVFADGRLSVGGREVPLEALRQKLQAAVARSAEQSVLVRGDQDARFGVGMQVLDACRLAKVKKVDFAALPAK